jgi:predicted acylesterase/phospholipase RssA
VGLVLGGGGARGLAHRGVVEALVAEGAPIDALAGTSQGAMMAALLARCVGARCCAARLAPAERAAEARALSRRMARRVAPLVTAISTASSIAQSLTLPLLSLFHGGRFTTAVHEALGDGHIEDLWLPFFCVSTSVSRCRGVLHRRGPLAPYVRASMSVVQLLPPVFDHRTAELLVDGGYSSNLPVGALRARCPAVRRVVAVDVEDKDNSAFEHVRPMSNYDGTSGWNLALQSALRFVLLRCSRALGALGLPRLRRALLEPALAWLGTLPSQSAIVMSLQFVAHSAQFHAARNTPSLYLRPPVCDLFSLLDYDRGAEMAEAALAYAAPQVGKWLASEGMGVGAGWGAGTAGSTASLAAGFRGCESGSTGAGSGAQGAVRGSAGNDVASGGGGAAAAAAAAAAAGGSAGSAGAGAGCVAAAALPMAQAHSFSIDGSVADLTSIMEAANATSGGRAR